MNCTRNKVSDRLFYYHQQDLRHLRARFRNIDIDMPNGLLNRMSRESLARGLVAHELGEKAVDDYFALVKVWNECRAFVEYGVEMPS